MFYTNYQQYQQVKRCFLMITAVLVLYQTGFPVVIKGYSCRLNGLSPAFPHHCKHNMLITFCCISVFYMCYQHCQQDNMAFWVVSEYSDCWWKAQLMSSCTERRPIGWRTESDRVADGIRSGGVRNLIGRRTESDWAAYGIWLGGVRNPTTKHDVSPLESVY